MQLGDLPDAAFFHIFILIQAHAPNPVGAGLGKLDHPLPARLGGAAVRRDRRDILELHVIVEAPLLQSLQPEQQHGAADSCRADIDTALTIFETTFDGEEIRSLIPQSLVEIIAVSRLQILDGVLIF